MSTADTATGARSGVAPGGPQTYEVDYVQVDTVNWQRLVAFYRDVLGLRPVLLESEHGYAQFRAGAIRLALRQRERDLSMRPSVAAIVFRVRDIRAEMYALQSHGCAMYNVQLDDDEGYSIIYFRDPDGNPLAIWARAPRRP